MRAETGDIQLFWRKDHSGRMPMGKRVANGLRAISMALPLALAGLVCSSLRAEQMSLREFGQADGLDNLAVNALVQDGEGAIWVGTDNGLYRHDATRMARVGLEEGVNGVWALAAGARGLWVGTPGELWFWDGVKLRAVRDSGRALGLDHRQAIAATARGVWVVSQDRIHEVVPDETGSGWKTSAPVEFDREPGKPAIQVSSLAVGPGGGLWFGCDQAICRLREGKLERWTAARGVPSDTWHFLLVASDGSLWARSSRHVLQLPPGASAFVGRARDDSDPDGFYPLAEDAQHRILSARRDGLIRWDGQSWEHFGSSAGLPALGRVTAILRDREDGIWLGMLGAGMLQWRGYGRLENWTMADGLPHSAVWAIARGAEVRGGKLHVATGTGVAVWSDAVRGFVPEPRTAGREVMALGLDAQDAMWAGTVTGALLAIDTPPGQARVTGFQLPAGDSRISRLRRDRSGRMWIATDGRLFRRSGTAGAPPEAIPAPVGSGELVGGICQDAQGALWTGRGTGAHRLGDDGWAPAVEVGMVVDDLVCLADGDLVAASQHHGLRLIARKGDQVSIEDITPPLLKGRQILSVLEDSRRWLWVGTDAGVAIWNRRHWRLLDQAGGLVWNDLSGFALHEDGDGTVWIGTSRGLSHVLRPQALFQSSVRVPLLRSVRHEGGEESTAGQFSLPWDRASLHVSLGLPSFRDRSRQAIEFRLVGLSDKWANAPGGEVWFSDLAPGAYRFETRSVDRDLEEYSPVAGFEFVVATPWWQTPAATFAGILLLSLLMAGGYRWRVRKLVASEHRLQALVAERTRELEASREQLREQATKDSLTGIWNRRAVLEILDRELTRARRERGALALVVADIDHFKTVNDTHGHPAGDAVLREFATRLVSWCRPYDSVGRIGGEEFMLVLPGLNLAREKDRARLHALHASISQTPMAVGTVTCSFGVVHFDPDVPREAAALIAAADAALYAAKRAGRNRVEMAATIPEDAGA